MRIIAALSIIVPAALFILIASLALPDNNLDQNVARSMKEIADTQEPLRYLMIGFTHAGGIPIMCLLAVSGAAWLAWRRQYVFALAWVVIFLSGGLLDMGLKRGFARDRPSETIRDAAVSESNKSFPSGHSMGSTVGYGMAAYLICLAPWPRSHKTLAILGLALLIACIGLSRIFLRAHWVTDVLGGFTIGLAWLMLGVSLLEWQRHRSVSG